MKVIIHPKESNNNVYKCIKCNKILHPFVIYKRVHCLCENVNSVHFTQINYIIEGRYPKNVKKLRRKPCEAFNFFQD